MTDGELGEVKLSQNTVKILIATIVAVALLSITTFAAYFYAKKRSGTTVLPGGVTYLGPSNEQKTPTAPLRFTIATDTPWTEQAGKTFPFTFSYPATLSLVVFAGDPTDAVAISWGNISPQQNVLLSVDNVAQNEKMSQYAKTQSKKAYVENWWQQFSGLKGVETVVEFVNAKGMKGYKAKYINYADQTPNDDVFFEIPGRPDLVIRMANGIVDPPVFDRMVDSVSWKQVSPTSPPPAAPTSPPAAGAQGAAGQ